MKRTALDALIELNEKNLAKWIARLENNQTDDFWTVEEIQKTIDDLESSISYDKKRRDILRNN
jgi:hypothetical protein